MNFDLTDAQRRVRDLCREFAEREIRPRAAEIDRADEFPWDLYKRMAELDILGMTVPPEYGGVGRRHGELVRRPGRARARVGGGGGRPAPLQAHVRHAAPERLRGAEAAPPPGDGPRRRDLLHRADGAGRGLRRGGRADDGHADRRRLGAQRHQALHHGGPPLRPGRGGRHDRPDPRARRHRAVPGGAGRPRLRARRQGAPPRRARPGDRRAGLRPVPGAAGGPPGAARRRLPAGDGLARQRPDRDRRPGARHRPGRDGGRAPRTRRSAPPSASRSPPSRRSSSCWPTCRRGSRARGSSSARPRS